jgi:ABC-type cobalamin/Fe3+-siderophores transport system ATPase subunit
MFEMHQLRVEGILHGITETFRYGELVGILGPNGAGKSTLLRVLAGVRRPDAGSVRINGTNVYALAHKHRARHIAYLPQQIPDDVEYTVEEFVSMGRYAHHRLFAVTPVSNREKERIKQALERFDLIPFQNTPMNKLSGGERQRAAIARCYVQEANIWLLDEPIANLDLYYQIQLLNFLQDLIKEGYLVIAVLHHLELAAHYCTRLVLLDHGNVYRTGEPQEVLTAETLKAVFRIDAKPFLDPFQNALRFSILRPEEKGT